MTPLQSVPAVGGQLKPATVLDASRQERSHGFPYFLPDGRHFLYLALSARSENTGVYVRSIDSTETKRLLGIRSEVRYAPPGYLLFVRDGALMAQPFDVGRLELSGDPFPVAEQVVSDAIFGNAMFSYPKLDRWVEEVSPDRSGRWRRSDRSSATRDLDLGIWDLGFDTIPSASRIASSTVLISPSSCCS